MSGDAQRGHFELVAKAQRAYDEGRWCGECEYGEVADPPCCLTYNREPALTASPAWMPPEGIDPAIRFTYTGGEIRDPGPAVEGRDA